MKRSRPRATVTDGETHADRARRESRGPGRRAHTRGGPEVDGAAGEVHEGDEGFDKRHERLPRDERSN